jgi:phage shock protein A
MGFLEIAAIVVVLGGLSYFTRPGRRVWNLISGIFVERVGEEEVKHAGAIYDRAIMAKIDRFQKLRKAVGGLEANRAQLETRINRLKTDTNQVNADLQAAIAQNNERLGPILLEKKASLEGQVPQLEEDLKRAEQEVNEYLDQLREAQNDVQKTREDKERSLAQAASDVLRRQYQDEISRLSTDAPELEALDSVRQSLEKLHGEAQVAKKLGDTDINTELNKLRRQASTSTAKSQFTELVKQAQAKSPSTQKTIGPSS